MRRQGIDAGPLHRVPAPLEVHLGFAPQAPQEVDLLFAARAPGVEVLAEGLVFGGAAADADAEADAPTGHPFQGRQLLGEQRGLPRRGDDHRGHEFDALRHRGDVGEDHQRFVQMPALRAQHLIRHAQVRVADVVRHLRERSDGAEVVFEFSNGQRDADFHWWSPWADRAIRFGDATRCSLRPSAGRRRPGLVRRVLGGRRRSARGFRHRPLDRAGCPTAARSGSAPRNSGCR